MEENKNTSKPWGGARKGAGRKKQYAKNLYFSATLEVLDILEAHEGNRSDFVNECILKATRES